MNEFVWDARAGQYRASSTGRFVSRASVRAALEAALLAEERSAISLVAQLRTGSISLAAWRSEMTDLIKTVHLYSAAAARGGWAQLTPEDIQRITTIVRREVSYLDATAWRISTHDMPLDGRVATYARQYALAGRETYDAVDRAVALETGYTHERNILHPADHCEDCAYAESLGWVPIGTNRPIGQRQCRRHCQCTMEYSKLPSSDL